MATLSIATVCLNAQATIGRTFKSVSSQVGVDSIQHLIQDGGSSDQTAQILADYQKAAKYSVDVVSQKDGGFYEGLNTALSRVEGDIVGVLNADDWLVDEFVLRDVCSAFLENPKVDIVYGDLEYVRMSSVNGDEKTHRRWRAGEARLSKFRNGWMPPHPTVYVRRAALERVGQYRLDLGSASDYEWLLRAFVVHGMRSFWIRRVLVRMHVGGQSNNSFASRLRANCADRRAWTVNGLRPYPWFRVLKPLRKLPQFISR